MENRQKYFFVIFGNTFNLFWTEHHSFRLSDRFYITDWSLYLCTGVKPRIQKLPFSMGKWFSTDYSTTVCRKWNFNSDEMLKNISHLEILITRIFDFDHSFWTFEPKSPASSQLSKHLKGRLGPRVGDVTFLDQRWSVGSPCWWGHF